MHGRWGRRHRSAWIGVAAVALVLKAAVPLLAALAAHAQGKAVAEICEIYGVRTVAMSAFASPAPSAPADHGHPAGHTGHADPAVHSGHAHAGHAAHEGHAAHAGHVHTAHVQAGADAPAHAPAAHGHDREHCGLTGLAACAAPAAPDAATVAAPLVATAPLPATQVAATRPDASASWLARRIHAPPGAA